MLACVTVIALSIYLLFISCAFMIVLIYLLNSRKDVIKFGTKLSYSNLCSNLIILNTNQHRIPFHFGIQSKNIQISMTQITSSKLMFNEGLIEWENWYRYNWANARYIYSAMAIASNSPKINLVFECVLESRHMIHLNRIFDFNAIIME